MKKMICVSVLIATALVAGEMPPMPPMPPALGNGKQHKVKKQTKMPKECELLPPMVIFLPPPMEAQLDSCKNALYKPKKEFAQKQLSKILKKKVIVKSITILKKFSKLYRIEYNGGTVLCNDRVDACIRQ